LALDAVCRAKPPIILSLPSCNFCYKIKNISAQDIQNAFARLINTDKFIVVSVGQKSKE
jgi:hypothetical protein